MTAGPVDAVVVDAGDDGDWGCAICVAHDAVWWHGAATVALRAARAASHDSAHASSASGWVRNASANVTTAMRRTTDPF